MANAYTAVAQKLRNARIARGWTQKKLARRMGITQQRLAKIEACDASPRLSTIDRMARALGVSFDVPFERDLQRTR